MPPDPIPINTDRIRDDFDRIAALGGRFDSGSDRYDRFLFSSLPCGVGELLEIGCGAGRLTAKVANAGWRVVAVDLSPAMIARARAAVSAKQVEFICGDFLELELGEYRFDCVLSSATLHHMPADKALANMRTLLKPGGRIIVHDVRRGAGPFDAMGMAAILSYEAVLRLLRTGSPLSPRRVRDAWNDHAAGETYLTTSEARSLFERCLGGARVRIHWGWRYTAIWDHNSAD